MRAYKKLEKLKLRTLFPHSMCINLRQRGAETHTYPLKKAACDDARPDIVRASFSNVLKIGDFFTFPVQKRWI